LLKVYHIISGDLWAGAEVMAYHLLNGLKSYGDLSITAIILNEGRLVEEIHKLGIRVHVVNESKTSFLNLFKIIKEILVQSPPNLIHSHRYKENFLAYLTSRSIPGIKLIGTQHGMPEVYGGNYTLKQRIITKCNFFGLSLFFNRTVAVSEDIQEAFSKQFGFRESKISMIHNGIKIPGFIPERENKEKFVIGSAGRLCQVKGYRFMIEIAKAVKEETKHIKFHLAGEGPERAKLQALIQQYSLNETFVLQGHLDDMLPFYRSLDLYLNTSVHEGIPMSILEAMAHGLPVVAPNVGGISEIINNGEDGYLIEKRDPKAFAEKCFLLYKNKQLRQRMAQAAREKIVKSFSVENMAAQYHELYLNRGLKD
jgi:glycosyltransferase involved in cell wall biosynthesis